MATKVGCCAMLLVICLLQDVSVLSVCRAVHLSVQYKHLENLPFKIKKRFHLTMLHGELHLKKPHTFLFVYSRFLTAPNARMYCVFWGTGVEHLRTLHIPLTKGSYQTILWKFLAIYSHSTRS